MRVPLLAPLLAAAGCFSPTVEEGATCSIEGACPPGQTCAADGRCYAETPDFHFARRIDIHPLSLTNVQRDFTLSVVLTADPGLAANARDDGLDLHFTEADGTSELAFEVESFDGEAGDLVAWVRVPLLSVEDTIYLHYGGDSFDRPAPASVWHERYLAVWHGGGDPGTLADSTGNHNDGASADLEAPERVTGAVGTALSFDGIDDQVLIEESVPPLALAPGAELLLTMWVRVANDSAVELATVIGKGSQSGSDPGFGVQVSGLAWLVRLRGSGTSDTEAALFGNDPGALIGRWVMLGVEITAGAGGEDYFEVATSVDAEGAGSGYWQCQTEPCGRDLGGALFLSHPEGRFQGMVDEIRIVDRTVGSESQRAEFENLADPETFYTVGPEETLGL